MDFVSKINKNLTKVIRKGNVGIILLYYNYTNIIKKQ